MSFWNASSDGRVPDASSMSMYSGQLDQFSDLSRVGQVLGWLAAERGTGRPRQLSPRRDGAARRRHHGRPAEAGGLDSSRRRETDDLMRAGDGGDDFVAAAVSWLIPSLGLYGVGLRGR